MVSLIMTAREVAALLAVDEVTVYRLARAGRLPAFKVGDQWRFSREALDGWMERQMQLPRDTDDSAGKAS